MTPDLLLWLAPIVFIVTLMAVVFGPKVEVIRELTRARVITTRPLAAIADQENDAYLKGDGFTGNAIADARIRLFDAIANTEKPTEGAIDHAIAILGKKSATVGDLATAVKYLQTGDINAPVRPGENWVQYMQRREREADGKRLRAENHERIASRIAAENRANHGGADTLIGHALNAYAADISEQAARMAMTPPPSFDMDAPLFTPLTAKRLNHFEGRIVADHATATVSFAKL